MVIKFKPVIWFPYITEYIDYLFKKDILESVTVNYLQEKGCQVTAVVRQSTLDNYTLPQLCIQQDINLVDSITLI